MLLKCDKLLLTEKKNLSWEHQALKPALFPHANIRCPDEQNAIN